MENKKLMIGIPTKDHSEYMQYYLSRILPDAEKNHVDIWVYDSSEDDLTKQIVEKKKKEGYQNVFYKRYPPEIAYWKKLKDIYVGSGYEYVWLCGDGLVIELAMCLDAIKKQMDKRVDCIVLGERAASLKRNMITTNPLTMFYFGIDDIGQYGRFLLRGDLFHEKEWDAYEKKYPDYLHVGACLEKFADKTLKTACIKVVFANPNPYKRCSSWISEGRVFEVIEHWMHMIDVIPDLYHPIKPVLREAIFLHLTEESLWVWRANGNLNVSAAVKYIKTAYQYKDKRKHNWNMLRISLCPQKAADLICTVRGAKSLHYTSNM